MQSILNSWLQDKNIEMYSTHNKEKFAVAEKLIRALKNKTWKYMSSVSKNVMLINQMLHFINTITHITEESK